MVKVLGALAVVATISGFVYFATPVPVSAKVVKERAPFTEVNGILWRNSFRRTLPEAKKSGKPILLLSMFGHIDEKMPCANARTLRATLFKDPDFMKLVDKEVIPVWEMVREVPRITIDLGDGKKIERTVRGNAVMYLVNPDGKVVDVYPGVYTAKDFLPMVRQSISETKGDDAQVIAYHEKTPAPLRPAREIAAVMSKAVLESPTLNLVGATAIRGAKTENPVTADQKRRRFLRMAGRVRDMSLTPMTTEEAVRSMTGKSISEFKPEELKSEILRIESERNVFELRPVVKLWFASLRKLPEPTEARTDILENLLKIPYRDPNFGLSDVLLPGTPE